MSSWLSDVFTTRKPQDSSDAGLQHDNVASQMLSDVDIGRRQMQSQQLARIQKELKLVQDVFESAEVIF